MERICLICHGTFEAKRSTAKYCGPRCRKRANRAGLSVPRERLITERIEPARVPAKQRKPSAEDLVHLVSEASALEASFRFASLKADPRFRPLCSRMADAIERVLAEAGLR